jgi:hypothetical protein
VYVHAELHGASSTIVRNHDPSRPVPPLTLQQAGCACVCRSKAWDAKLVTSAWWVYHHQVGGATGGHGPPGVLKVVFCVILQVAGDCAWGLGGCSVCSQISIGDTELMDSCLLLV